MLYLQIENAQSFGICRNIHYSQPQRKPHTPTSGSFWNMEYGIQVTLPNHSALRLEARNIFTAKIYTHM